MTETELITALCELCVMQAEIIRRLSEAAAVTGAYNEAERRYEELLGDRYEGRKE